MSSSGELSFFVSSIAEGLGETKTEPVRFSLAENGENEMKSFENTTMVLMKHEQLFSLKV